MSQNKVEITEPKQKVTINNLPTNDPRQLISTSSYWHNKYQAEQETLVSLEMIAHGKQDEAEILLKRKPWLLSNAGSVKDINGRIFPRITAFQYAIWALDSQHMAQMILRCIPEGELGDNIRIDLLQQLATLKEKGVEYTFEGNKVTGEKHFDCQPLFDAYNTLKTDDKTINWLKVGVEQSKIPAHFRHEMCNPEQALKENGFTNNKLKRSLAFYNFTTFKNDTWDEHLSDLGKTFAIERSAAPKQAFGAGNVTNLEVDAEALARLHSVRLANVEEIHNMLLLQSQACAASLSF